MKYYIVYLLILLTTGSVYADFVTYSGNAPNYNNGFQSKLNMNQPKTTIASYSGSRRQNRLYPHHCPNCQNYNPYLSKNDLNALEKYALNKTYRRESDLQRLERLENLAFGSSQYGDLHSRYKNVENAILSRPKYNTNRSILGNLANYFSGQTTGFTPSLTSYPAYNNLGGFSSNPYLFTQPSGYQNNSYEQYSNGIFGGGWGVRGSDFGTGSSIRILD